MSSSMTSDIAISYHRRDYHVGSQLISLNYFFSRLSFDSFSCSEVAWL